MKLIIVNNYEDMSTEATNIFNKAIQDNPKIVLGLATGSTPEGMYDNLIAANKLKLTDWSNVTTFNLDEYVGLRASHKLSYHSYMDDKLFNHVNIQRKNTHLPKTEGNISRNGKDYDYLIELKGGIDLQVLGIGENAHIAFNEPGSKKEDGTREVRLTASTINANARYFRSPSNVPKTAITMGIKTILKAKKIILLASGAKKAQAIYDTIYGDIGPEIPSSFLREHNDVTLIVDKEAAQLLQKDIV